jgi:basic amino acid/polyamine antiporter, APA family
MSNFAAAHRASTPNQRDAGLVRAIGPWALGASIVNVVVGAGIFAVPAALAANIGPYAPLAFLVCAVAISSVAICFAEGGSRIPTSGGAYGYANAAFGPLTGYVSGTVLWFSNALACGGIAAALADIAGTLLPLPLRSFARAIVIIGVVGGIALINLGGVARGARLIAAATVLKLIPLLIVIVAGVGAVQRTNFVQLVHPGTADLGRALILALFAFQGMETPLSASGEVRNPARTIPRALAISILSVTALYVAIQFIAQGILGTSLSQSTAPLADAMGRISPALRLLMLAGAAASMFGWIGSDILGTPRVLFAFARDGLLPHALGRVNVRSQTPRVAILCYAAVVIGLALSGTFAELAVLSALGTAALYIAGCAAAWYLSRRGVAFAGPPFTFRWLGAAAAIGIGSMVALIALASRAEIVGLLAVLGGSAAVYVLQTRLARTRT